MTFRRISTSDRSAYSEIIELSNAILDVTLRPLVEAGCDLSGEGLCRWYSDAVTRAAHGLGIVAARQRLANGHLTTSFAPLDRLPGEDDLILDRTWDQFLPLHKQAPPFFGTKRELADLVPAHSGAFTASAVQFSQIIHRPGRRPVSVHQWLCTTPAEVASGEYQIGQVGRDAYLDRKWR